MKNIISVKVTDLGVIKAFAKGLKKLAKKATPYPDIINNDERWIKASDLLALVDKHFPEKEE